MNPLTGQPLVLVIGEDPASLSDLAATLSTANFEVLERRTPQEAILAAQDTPPDLIISDVMVRSWTGLEICERIRQVLMAETLPVMFLSRSQSSDIIRRHHSFGGTYYLRKPLEPRVLLSLIEKALALPALVGA